MRHRSEATHRPTPLKSHITTVGLANDETTGPRLELAKYWYFDLTADGQAWVADTSTPPFYGITVWFDTPKRRAHIQVQPVDTITEALKRAERKLHAKGLSITDHDRIWLDATLFDLGLTTKGR